MYTYKDYQSKKALREELERGKKIEVYQPGPFGGETPQGRVYLEGPHYPKPHKWYAAADVVDGIIVKLVK